MPQVGENAFTNFPGAIDTLNADYDPNIGPAVIQLEFTEGCVPVSTLTGITSQTVPDQLASSTVTLTAGTIVQTYIGLQKGQIVSKLSIVTAATAAGTPTNSWAGLASPVGATPKVVAISADGLTGAIAANSVVTFTLSSPYTVPTTGWYLAFVCVAATTGPTAAAAPSLGAAGRGAIAPFVSGPGATAQTTPPALGATLTATTASGAIPLIYAN